MTEPGRSLAELFTGALLFAGAVWTTLPRIQWPPSAPARVSLPARQSEPASAAATASYTLKARLDADAHRVSATGTIEFVNRSRAPLNSLFFHLYLNAFKNDRTLFLRSPFGAGRSGAHAREYGYIDVSQLKARELGDVDLWPQRVRHSPSDPEDETDIEVPLPRALAPGATLTLDVAFVAQLPQIVERTGYAGSFHFIAQWFPKLAKLEPDGTFAHFAFHPQAEFYADFGRYDVTLDVPRAYVVGATGVESERREVGARRELRYIADSVHDFAWTAWDHFVEARTRIGNVDVRLLSPPGHAATDAVSLASVRFALPYFGERYGHYPYATLTLVHPPENGAAAGGMEYPTLITTGGPWYLPYTGARAIEDVVVHELGHQWFYGLIASNEPKWPFLDEGLNSFAELSVLSAAYGKASSFRGFGLELSEPAFFRAFAAARGADEAVASEAQEFSTFRNLGALVYSRTAVLMETAARVWGRERVDRALFDYAERWRFASPTPADFLAVMRAEVGAAAADFLEAGLFRRGTVDFVLRELETATEQPPAGFFERANGREHVQRAGAGSGEHLARLTVYRHGALELPVDVRLVSADGQATTQHWDGRGPLHTFYYRGQSPLVRAVVDPEHAVLIDDDLSNNAASVAAAPLVRVHERLGYFASLALAGLAP